MNAAVLFVLGAALLAAVLEWKERRDGRAPRPWSPDLLWWALTPGVAGVLTRLVTFGVVGLLLWSPSGDVAEVRTAIARLSSGGIGRLPWPAQVVATFLLADGVGYLSHRLRHRYAWRFHHLHHAEGPVDWRTAARLHPIDDLIDNTLVGVSLLLSGVPLAVFVWVGPVLLVHTMLTHTHCDWSFGPLDRWIVSPAVHRTHHRPGGDGNYAGMFAFFDVMFGTWRAPVGGDAFGDPGLSDNVIDRLTLRPADRPCTQTIV